LAISSLPIRSFTSGATPLSGVSNWVRCLTASSATFRRSSAAALLAPDASIASAS
jgi:hypothetical protein